MSDILKHIEENPKETRRLIGLEYEQLQQLIKNAEESNYEKQALRESKKIRIIAGGGGRKPKISVKEQIILTLVYLRQMTTLQKTWYPVWSE
jgi:PHP family Zn ribbon phosphoesterase